MADGRQSQDTNSDSPSIGWRPLLAGILTIGAVVLGFSLVNLAINAFEVVIVDLLLPNKKDFINLRGFLAVSVAVVLLALPVCILLKEEMRRLGEETVSLLSFVRLSKRNYFYRFVLERQSFLRSGMLKFSNNIFMIFYVVPAAFLSASVWGLIPYFIFLHFVSYVVFISYIGRFDRAFYPVAQVRDHFRGATGNTSLFDWLIFDVCLLAVVLLPIFLT